MADKVKISVDADAAFYDAVDALCRKNAKNEEINMAMNSLFIVAYESGLLDWSDTYSSEDGAYWMEFKISGRYEELIHQYYWDKAHP